MIGFKLLTIATCLAGAILAQDYQEYRQAPLRIGTKAEEPKPTPIPILKQINSDRSGYYRKRCFAAVRNNCKLRSGDKIHSKFIPTGAGAVRPVAEPVGVRLAAGNVNAEVQRPAGGKKFPKPYQPSTVGRTT